MAERTAEFSDTPRMSEPATERPAPADAFAALARYLAEARAFLGFYVTAQLDRLKLTARKLAIFAVLGVLAGIAGATAIVVATLFVCLGFAGLIGAITGYPWIGYLVIGVLILAGAIAGVVVAGIQLTKMAKQSTFAGYQRRKRQQRETYGTDVHERAHGN